MNRIRWSPDAANDLEIIRDFLREHHPSFTRSTVNSLYAAARSLSRMPQRRRVGRAPGTRELVLTPLPYIIVYGIEEKVVHIYRILHAAQDRQ